MLTLVLGGPGCGKTTALLNIIDDLLSRGVAPNKIAYLTFTKKAAQEGLTRAMEKFNFEQDDLPYFRTLHSLAFQQLALDPNMVMTETNWREFGAVVGLQLTAPPEGEIGGKPGSQFLSAVQFARLRQRPLRSVCQDLKLDLTEAEYIESHLAAFKRDRGLVDFTDMLEAFRTEGVVPPVDYLIVDEGQDLSTLQWQIVDRIAKRVDDMWVAGDDDQAIYEWAGADVERFLKLEGKKIVLPISYRLKTSVFDVTQGIAHTIRDRFDKDWKPHADGGEIDRVNGIEHVNLDEGSWYLLARNHYLLEPLRQHLRDKGYSYLEHEQSSTDNANVRAMIHWEALRKGEKINVETLKEIWNRLKRDAVESSRLDIDPEAIVSLADLRGHYGLLTDAPWFEVMRFNDWEIEYYRACRQRGEKLLARPRITLSTIHGVKGGQADNVFLMSDMAPKSYEALVRKKSDEEKRVFYVATSRAKERLIINNPVSPRYFDLTQ